LTLLCAAFVASQLRPQARQRLRITAESLQANRPFLHLGGLELHDRADGLVDLRGEIARREAF